MRAGRVGQSSGGESTADLQGEPAARAPVDLWPIGSVLGGRYRLTSLLGTGGFGVVYGAVDLVHPEQATALKLVRRDRLTPEQVDAFKTEFQTLAQLRHPNIASVYDFEQLKTGGDYCFSMEYVAGANLFDATAATTLENTIGLLVQACRALSFLHSRRVVHYDVKPKNMLVDASGTLKLLDFGICGTPHSGDVRGTPAYMAPEVIEGAACDHRADLYALGISLYEVLCRRLPFVADTPAALLEKQMCEPLAFDPADRARIPSWLQELVTLLCAKSKEERPASAAAVIRELNERGGSAHALETPATTEGYLLSGRFVGREHEHADLVSFIQRRTRGEADGAAAFVCGPSGVGKSRLVREVKNYAQLDGLPFVEGHCYDGAFAELGPLGEALRHLVVLAQGIGRGELVDRYASALLKLEPALAHTASFPSAHGPELERVASFEAVCSFLLELARAQPYVLYLNDLQWARPGTVEFLGVLLRHLSSDGAHLALLGSYRDDEIAGRPLDRLVDALFEEGSAKKMALAPLDAQGVGAVLGSMFGIDRLPPAFVERVAIETAGNPFFVEEVSRVLLDRGLVHHERGAWVASAAIGDLEIPASVAAVFRHRVALLAPSAAAALRVLAAYARPVSPAIVAAVIGDDASAALDALCQRQMAVALEGAPAPLFRVYHDRMRETVYADIASHERAQLHLRIAEGLERMSAEAPDAYLYELAHHYRRSENGEKALAYCLKAGEKAAGAYATHLAVELFEDALSRWPAQERDGAEARALIATLAELQTLTGRYPQAIANYDRLLRAPASARARATLLRRKGEALWHQNKAREAIDALWSAAELLGQPRPRAQWQLQLKIGRAFALHAWHRRFPSTVRMLDGEAARDAEELAEIYSLLGQVHVFYNPTGFALCFSAANYADRVPVFPAVSDIHAALALVYSHMSDFEAAARSIEISRRVALDSGSPVALARANVRQLDYHFLCGRMEQAAALFADTRKQLIDHGNLLELGLLYVLHGSLLTHQGKLEEALAISEEGLKRFHGPGAHFEKGVLSNAGCAAMGLGKREMAFAYFERASSLAQKADDKLMLIAAMMQRLEGCICAGEPLAVPVAELERATRAARARVTPMFRAMAENILTSGILLDLVQRRERVSRRLLLRLWRLTRRCRKYAPPLYAPHTLANEACVAALRGRSAEADALFVRASAITRQSGARLSRAQLSYYYGATLRSLGNERAAAHLADAAAQFDALGAAGWAAAVRSASEA